MRLREASGLLRKAGMQREKSVATAGFLAARFHESWSRSAAVRVGRQSTFAAFVRIERRHPPNR